MNSNHDLGKETILAPCDKHWTMLSHQYQHWTAGDQKMVGTGFSPMSDIKNPLKKKK